MPRDTPQKRERVRTGLTLSAFALRAGMSKGFYSLYERNRYTPTDEELARIDAVIAEYESGFYNGSATPVGDDGAA